MAPTEPLDSTLDVGFGAWSSELEIGPPPTSRQRKATASYCLEQLLALADLRAVAALRKQHILSTRHPRGGTHPPPLNHHLQAVIQLRQSAAKRQAEEQAAGHQPAASAAAAVTSVGRKPIVVVPPPGAAAAGAPATAPLGCHLARRCPAAGGRTATPGGAAGGSGRGAAEGSSLARVYGSRIRVSELPEDYAEYFQGLEPVAQPEPAEELDPMSPLLDPNAVHKRQRLGPDAAAATMAPGAMMLGGAPVASSGNLLGSGAVGAEVPFLMQPHPHGAFQQQPEPQAMSGGMAAPPAGGLLAPFLPPQPSAAAGAAATPADPSASLMGLPYGTMTQYGTLGQQPLPSTTMAAAQQQQQALYGAVAPAVAGAALGGGGGMGGGFGGVGSVPARAVGADELMLDDDDDDHEDDDDDEEEEGDGDAAEMDTQLGDAFDALGDTQ
ncbi:hypothetical protein Agub_g13876, partial [Astrephomene gubernaculifera]